jgi:pilus assembly protein CpaC
MKMAFVTLMLLNLISMKDANAASANDGASAPAAAPAPAISAESPDLNPTLDTGPGNVPPNIEGPAQTTPVVKRRRPPPKGPSYGHSQLTSDKTEAEADHRELILGQGSDKIVDLDPSIQMNDKLGSIIEGNTNVVRVTSVTVGTAHQLIFKPVGEGQTTVDVRDKSGKVRIMFKVFVAKQDVVRYLERLKENLKEVEGITIGLEDQKVVIRGEVLSPADYGEIVNELADKTYGDSVINKATMSPITMNALAKRIEQDVQVFAPTVHCGVLNGKIILEGTVESEGLRQRCLRRAEWYLPTVRVSDPIAGAANIEKNDKPLQIIQSDIQVTPPPPKRESKLVRLTVYFVELKKDFNKAFGFKWQPGFTADPSISIGSAATATTGTAASGGFTFAGTLSSLFPTLNAPPSNASFGRILKSESVVVKSEQKAQVKDTQSVPTQALGQNGTVANGTPVTLGFSSEITPTILQGQDVDLSISLDQTNQTGTGVGGAPITATHHVETRMYLKSGEVAAVVGVNSQDVITTFNRDDPAAGSFATTATKPLFTLQRSKNSSKKRGQFVVFVSPQIIESASEGTDDLKKNFRMKTGN